MFLEAVHGFHIFVSHCAHPTVNGILFLCRTKGLAKSFSAVPQFQQVDVMVTQGQRIGLLGINGAGKSTFMKCIAGIEGVEQAFSQVD